LAERMTVVKFHAERLSRGSPKQRFDVPVKHIVGGVKETKFLEIDLNLMAAALVRDGQYEKKYTVNNLDK